MKVESLILSVCSALLWALGGLETINIYLYRTATVFSVIILWLYLRHCINLFINYLYYLYVKALGVEDQKSWYRWYATGILCQTSFSDMFYKEYLIVGQNFICSLSLIFFSLQHCPYKYNYLWTCLSKNRRNHNNSAIFTNELFSVFVSAFVYINVNVFYPAGKLSIYIVFADRHGQ